jgi:hypothetical protein
MCPAREAAVNEEFDWLFGGPAGEPKDEPRPAFIARPVRDAKDLPRTRTFYYKIMRASGHGPVRKCGSKRTRSRIARLLDGRTTVLVGLKPPKRRKKPRH